MGNTAEPLGDTDLLALTAAYRLRLDVKSAAGTIGLKEGRETGASVEIQDFRDYVPGDDPRRIDWLAYARTDRLVVRLFREEVSPFLDLIIDTSASMALPDGRKQALAAELVRWLYHSARTQSIAVRIFAAGADMRRVEAPDELAFSEAESVLFAAPLRAAAALRRSSVRVLLTDFMDPADPAALLRALSAGCTRLIVIHLLGPWEANPRLEGPAVLDAVEGGRRIDVNLDSKAVADYRRRLQALAAQVKDEAFKCGGLYVSIIADRGIAQVLKDDLLPTGLVEV